ncbi:CsgG/HfaB family protein [Brevundimonas aurantiaca]|uniref:CsgG/HfaB family protein n=1 Tax=Brevundimonas aurantiaca TaxID=74316 RepID=UPI002FDF03F2
MQRLSTQMTAALCVAAVGMSGCVGAHYDPATGLYARTLGGAPATPNPTPYTQSLECLARAARAQSLRGPTLAVGAISDLTGKNDWDTGRKVSQGAALFAMTALGRAGLPVVERYDRSVSDIELAYAQTGALSGALIGETTPAATIAPRTPSEPDPEVVSTVVPADATALAPRPVLAGQIAGSRYYIVGGVTELNYNIRSSGVDAAGGEVDSQGAKGSFRNSAYVMNIAIDLRLVDSVSQQVAAVASYQKQLIGREIKAGVFDFLDGNVFDISGGASQLEPMQLGIRTLVERGVFDLASHLYGFDRSVCLPDGLESEDGVTPLLPLGPHHILMAEDAAPRIARAVEPEIERRLEAATPIPLPVQTASNRSVQAHPGPAIEPGTWRVRR